MISNFERFQEIQKQQILKVTAPYLMWNPEIGQGVIQCLRRQEEVGSWYCRLRLEMNVTKVLSIFH